MGSYAPRFTQCSTVALPPWEHSAVFGDRFSLSRLGGGHWHLVETGRRMSRHTQGGPHTQDCLAQDVAGAAAACDTRVTASWAAGVGAATADSGHRSPPREVVALLSGRAFFRTPRQLGAARHRCTSRAIRRASPAVRLGLCPSRW